MSHLNEEQLVEAYYEGLPPVLRQHLDLCAECQALRRSIAETLVSADELTVPERGPGYGAEVWARVLPRLPLQKPAPALLRVWLPRTALASVLALMFVAGLLTEHKRNQVAPIQSKTNERVLYLTLSDHLEQAQITLTELAHSVAPEERQRARDLLTQNRILRQRTLRHGDVADAALLDDLERILVEVANGNGDSQPDDLETVRRRIKSGNLLFRVRIGSSDARLKGENL